MTDFNTLYEAASPYIGTSTLATIIVLIVVLAYKVLKLAKEAKILFSNTYAQSIEAFKKAIPKNLYVSIEGLAKNELAKIKTEIVCAVEEKWINQMSNIPEFMQAVAIALISVKSVPDSAKNSLAKFLNVPQIDTTASLKVDCLEIDSPVEEKPIEKPLID